MSLSPTIVIVGRPNVGKSTLFNALVGGRRALVADKEGVTRDRREFTTRLKEFSGREVRVIDTGGWLPESWRRERADAEILRGIEEQVVEAMRAESGLILLVVDARNGLLPLDREIASFLRKQGKNFIVVCNKIDSERQAGLEDDFHSLGGEQIIAVSAEHKRGIGEIWTLLSERFPRTVAEAQEPQDLAPALPRNHSTPWPAVDNRPLRIVIVGRPNVGKSSLLNSLLGEKRAVESNIPGTTTDPIDVDVEKNGEKFTIVDTAGIRRTSKRHDDVEDLGVLYAKRNLETVDLALLVIDAADGMTTQDSRIAELVANSGAAAIILANKWDLAPKDLTAKEAGKSVDETLAESIREQCPFLEYAPILGISAREKRVYFHHSGEGARVSKKLQPPNNLEDLWSFSRQLVSFRDRLVDTGELNEVVQAALVAGPNISQNIGQIQFAVRVPARTPVFCAYVRNPDRIPKSYRRFLARTVREKFGFPGNPIRWIFRRKKEMKAEPYALAQYKLFRKTEQGQSRR